MAQASRTDLDLMVRSPDSEKQFDEAMLAMARKKGQQPMVRARAARAKAKGEKTSSREKRRVDATDKKKGDQNKEAQEFGKTDVEVHNNEFETEESADGGGIFSCFRSRDKPKKQNVKQLQRLDGEPLNLSFDIAQGDDIDFDNPVFDDDDSSHGNQPPNKKLDKAAQKKATAQKLRKIQYEQSKNLGRGNKSVLGQWANQKQQRAVAASENGKRKSKYNAERMPAGSGAGGLF
jgi:hypothetical protein